jgi:hypothetical protein
MKKLSGATSKKVTADWAEMFPELAVFEPLVLLRRVGPLLQGVGFERSRASDAYVPSTGVQFLGFPFGDALSGLDSRLRTANGTNRWLELKWHESEYRDAAEQLRKQSPVPFEGFTLPAVLKAHRARAESRQLPGAADGVQELEVLVLLPGLLGRDDLVEDGLKLARKLSADWPPQWYERWGKPADWLDDLARRAADQAGLQKIVDSEVKKIGLDDVPFSELPDK